MPVELRQAEPHLSLDTIELLETLLAEAREGELLSVAIACVYKGRVVANYYIPEGGTLYDLIAETSVMHSELVEAAKGTE